MAVLWSDDDPADAPSCWVQVAVVERDAISRADALDRAIVAATVPAMEDVR